MRLGRVSSRYGVRFEGRPLMRGTTLTLGRWGKAFLLAGFGLIALGRGEVAAQSVFDPYLPYSGDYASSSFPSVPNNLALPGSARDVGDYNNPQGAISRYNTFQSYVNGVESGAVRGGGLGGRASQPSGYEGGYVANREADREFARWEAERDRRYRMAMAEKDPARKAAMFKAIARMRPPTSTRAPRAQTATAAAPRTMQPAEPPRVDRKEALAAEALKGIEGAAPSTTNSGTTVRLPATNSTDPRNNNRRSGVSVPLNRPAMEGERNGSSTPPSRP